MREVSGERGAEARRRVAGIEELARVAEGPTPPSLDRVVRLAASLAGSSAAAIHVIDDTTQQRIAASGAPLEVWPREDAMCRVVVEDGKAIATGDATRDDRFAHSSFVRGADPVRFYAAAPLEAPTFGVLGTLCVWDTQARSDAAAVLDELQDLAGVVVDALEALRSLRLLAEVAATDELTGLANRRQLLDALNRSLAACEVLGGQVVVLYLDLDGFKAVNDRHGHAIGDDVLRQIADRLQRVADGRGVAGRIGGDEFVIASVDPELGEPHWADRVREALAAPIPTAVGDQFVTASVGVALARAGESADALVRRADHQMFLAKRAAGG